MVETAIKVLSVVIMVAVIVSVDYFFLRDEFKKRLVVNIGIVLLFLIIYLTFLNS